MGYEFYLTHFYLFTANPKAEDCISDYLIRQKADRLKAEGFVDAGYKYIVIDSCWVDETRYIWFHLMLFLRGQG